MWYIIQLFLAFFSAAFGGFPEPPVASDPAPVVEVVEETTPAETEKPAPAPAPTTAAPTTAAQIPAVRATPAAGGFKAYRIYGTVPAVEWQKALYDELQSRGIAWYMPYAVCQVWQESRWNRLSDNGQDKGITQQKGIYWDARAARYGIPGADIWDVTAQFHVFAAMMAEYLHVAGGDVGMALSYYFYGSGAYAPEYVAYVTSHLAHLEIIN